MDGMSQPRMGMVDSCSERLIDAEISGLAIAEGKAAMSADEELVDVVCVLLSQSHPSADSTTDLPGRSRRIRNLYAPPASTSKPVSSFAYGASGVVRWPSGTFQDHASVASGSEMSSIRRSSPNGY